MKFKIVIVLLFICNGVFAKYWDYLLPQTEEGGQVYRMCELYFAENDLNNLYIVAKKGRAVEPKAFYFADKYAQAAYETERATEVLNLSDSLVKSEFANSYTYATNAWIHEWIRDFQNASLAFKSGMEKFPRDLDFLEKASSFFQDRKNWPDFIVVANKILVLDPYHEATHYDLFLYYDKQNNLPKALLHGESTLFMAPFSADNLTVKNKLYDIYTKIALEHKQKLNSKLGFIDDMFQGASKDLTSLNSLSDIIYFQSVLQYNYNLWADKSKPENVLYKNIFDYKKKIMDDGYWDTCWSWVFGNTKFPDMYKAFIESNATVLSGFLQWLNDNKLGN